VVGPVVERKEAIEEAVRRNPWRKGRLHPAATPRTDPPLDETLCSDSLCFISSIIFSSLQSTRRHPRTAPAVLSHEPTHRRDEGTEWVSVH
jgi:hypothetical protein